MKELMAKVEQKKKEIDGNRIDGSVLLSKYAEKWAETYKKPNVSPAWYADIERRLKKAVEAIGDKPIGKIKSIEVQAYLNTLTKYTDGHIKKSYDSLNQLFTRAYKDGLIAHIDLECPRGKKQAIGRSLTEQERKILLEVLNGHRGETFCKLMLYCGLRGGEVAQEDENAYGCERFRILKEPAPSRSLEKPVYVIERAVIFLRFRFPVPSQVPPYDKFTSCSSYYPFDTVVSEGKSP